MTSSRPGSASGLERPTRRHPPASGGEKSWLETMRLLEEQHESLENMLQEQSMMMDHLLKQHKAGLVQHRQALEQQLKDAHKQSGQLPHQPSPGAQTCSPPVPGSRSSWSKDWTTDSDMESDFDSVEDSVTGGWIPCLTGVNVPGLARLKEAEEAGKQLLNRDDIDMGSQKDFTAEPGSLQEKAIKIVSHVAWPLFTSLLILVQTFVLGVLVSSEVKHLLQKFPGGEDVEIQEDLNKQRYDMWKKFSWVLLVMWMMEMIIRMVAGGRQFFRRGGAGVGNTLELLLLAFGLLDLLPQKIFCQAFDDVRDKVKIFRGFRLLRLLTVCQTFKALHQLRWMLLYILTCLPSFGWALLLLVMVMFIWAILLEDIAIFYLSGHIDLKLTKVDDDIVGGIKSGWAGIDSAMMSLAFSLTGGDDYSTFLDPFRLINPLFGWLYILIVVMMTLCFFNVLVGIFVADSEGIVSWDRNLVLTEAVKKNDFEENILRQLFDEIDTNMNGEIRMKEMQLALKRPKIRAWFLHLGIDMAANTKVFFDLLDNDNSGGVNAQEFVDGCARLKGGAKPLSLESLRMDTKILSETVKRLDAEMRARRL